MDPSLAEEKIFSAISRSVSVVHRHSNQINQHLLQFISVSEILLIVVCMQAYISSIQSLQGFNISWHMLKVITQSIIIQPTGPCKKNMSLGKSHIVIIFDLILMIEVLDWVPVVNR